jgi:hypothetical protein
MSFIIFTNMRNLANFLFGKIIQLFEENCSNSTKCSNRTDRIENIFAKSNIFATMLTLLILYFYFLSFCLFGATFLPFVVIFLSKININILYLNFSAKIFTADTCCPFSHPTFAGKNIDLGEMRKEKFV